MQIQQFYDSFLAHASYAILSEGEIVLIDPARNPQPYYDFTRKNNAKIIAVIETHPHADFISSHAEISITTGAKIYVSKLVNPGYKFSGFDDGDVIKVGKLSLRAINTPGHSPDSISVLLTNEVGHTHAVFTGDTLFLGDVGRPDLREKVGDIQQKREELAKAMYHSLRNKLMILPPETIIYPAHGAGSLCGKNMSKETSGTIGQELANNYALQPMSEDNFVKLLLEDQPFVPKYFPQAVELNKKGAKSFSESVNSILRIKSVDRNRETVIIDTRPQEIFKQGHIPGSINNQEGTKFETWLGSILSPGESFYLIAKDETTAKDLIKRIASIGYEDRLEAYMTEVSGKLKKSSLPDLNDFELNPSNYTIVDIRNAGEVKNGKIFEQALTIPLYELRERLSEIPTDKPIMVHCAGGYRSAAGSSIIEAGLNLPVYDLSEAIHQFNLAIS